MLNIDSQNPHKLLKEIILKSLIFARKNQLIVKLFMRTIVDKGGLGEKNKEEFMFQLLEDSAEVMTGILNMKLEEARFLLVSLNHLIVRYSLHSEEDLRSTFKLKADQDLCPYLAEKMTNMVLNHSSL